MTTNQAATRSEMVRRRRTQSVPQSQPQKVKRSYRPESAQVSLRPQVTKRNSAYHPGVQKSKSRHLEIAFNTSRTSVRTPGITLPVPGPRLASGITVLVMGLILFSFYNSSLFKIEGARLIGNQRLSETEINAALQVIGKPIFSAKPDQIKIDLLSVYPDISAMKVSISLPDRVTIQITERTPMILWQLADGTSYWIDSQGFKFPARGQVDSLVRVLAFGEPHTPPAGIAVTGDPLDGTTSAFIDPSMIKLITDLAAIAPAGSAISFDPSYGFGWSDPRGWLVYLGENTEDVSMKMTIYQAIIDKLSQEGVQPTLISVEYLDAPFYRTQ